MWARYTYDSGALPTLHCGSVMGEACRLEIEGRRRYALGAVRVRGDPSLTMVPSRISTMR
jgi:hypothetical protein